MAASGKGSALTGLLLARRRRRGAVDLLVRSKVGDAAPAVFDDLIFSVTPPTLYYVVYPSAESEPSAAQIKAGQKQSGAAATASGSETARTTTGEEVFAAAAGGLSGATSYRVALVWSDGTNDSNVVVSSAWATWNSGSLDATESGQDTAAISSAPPVTTAYPGPAGKSRGKRRRVVIRERVYEVNERDIPALIEAELLDRAPPATAEHVAGPKPPQKRRKSAPQPVKTVEQVREVVQQIKARIEPDNAWLVQALEAVAFRVLERLQDEEDSLMLLLAA